MNRLTEWYDDGEVKGILVKEYPSENSMKTLYQKFGNQTDYSDTDEGYLCAEKLKEYEDLEEQGLLLKLPCKVGDTVYAVTRDFISKYTICSIEKYNEGLFFNWRCEKGICINVRGFTNYDIGKTVFLTQAEAEEALKKMRETEE